MSFFIMKTTNVQQIKVIYATTAAEFQEAFNKAQQELAGKNPSVQFNMAEGHCAYITYTESKDIPETLEDEFELAGASYHCRNCPKFEWPRVASGEVSKVKKRGSCPVATYGIAYRNGRACDFFYRSLVQGEIDPIEDEELLPYQID